MLLSNTLIILRSTALRLTALNGKIRFFEEGRITPFPSWTIVGYHDVKSSCFPNDEVRVTPLLFLTVYSTFRTTTPCNLFVGRMLTIFEAMLTVYSAEG